MIFSVKRSGVNYLRQFKHWRRHRNNTPNAETCAGFAGDDSGAVTADMVLLLAATVSLAFALSNTIGTGAVALADTTSEALDYWGEDLATEVQSR